MARTGFLGFNATKNCSNTRNVSVCCFQGTACLTAMHTSLHQCHRQGLSAECLLVLNHTAVALLAGCDGVMVPLQWFEFATANGPRILLLLLQLLLCAVHEKTDSTCVSLAGPSWSIWTMHGQHCIEGAQLACSWFPGSV
jgi:hypothetical protein